RVSIFRYIFYIYVRIFTHFTRLPCTFFPFIDFNHYLYKGFSFNQQALDRGVLIESGTHQELMAKRGHYYYLNHQQLDVAG
uniref:hypothetical protein n=1 Tax=Nostoc sp. TaxID=1180 RepID=UPI00359399CB